MTTVSIVELVVKNAIENDALKVCASAILGALAYYSECGCGAVLCTCTVPVLAPSWGLQQSTVWSRHEQLFVVCAPRAQGVCASGHRRGALTPTRSLLLSCELLSPELC